MRTLVAAAVASSILVSLGHAQSSEAAIRKNVNIGAQDLPAALKEFARERKLYLIFDDGDVARHRTLGATGEMTQDEVLGRLLQNTGLTYRYLDENTVMVVPLATAPALTPEGAEDAGKEAQKKSGFWERFRVAEADASDSEVKKTAEDPVRLQEVVVTSQKREERLQDVPISIAVISNEDIARRGLNGFEDYLRSIPGVNQIDSAIFNSIIIRGITTGPSFENLSTAGPTVATYFGETPITAAGGPGGGGIDVRPVDLEQIEVLRGPQGATYGSSSLAGALRLIPAKPQLDGFNAKVVGSSSLTSGDGGDNWMGQGVINIPLIQDKLAVRAVAYRFDDSGFYRNVAGTDATTVAFYERYGLGDLIRNHVQDDVGRMVSTGGRFAVSWQPTDALNVSLNYLTQKIDQDGNPFASAGKFTQVSGPTAPEHRVRGQAGEVSDTDLELANLVLNYDLGWAALTSAASWVDSGSEWVWDFSQFFGVPGSANDTSDFESFSAETRLASKLEGRLQFLAGVFYEDVKQHHVQSLDWPGTPEANPVALPTDPTFFVDGTGQRDQSAVFGEVSYALTEKLTATAGARYFKYETEGSSVTEGGFVNVATGTGVPTSSKGSENGTTFKANLSYKPTSDALLYASWAEGFRLGAVDDGPGLPAAVCDLDSDGVVDGTSITLDSTKRIDSDVVDNYEIGAKFALFNRRMVIDAAVYHIDWTGLPTLSIINCPGGLSQSYSTNAGAARSRGVEVQASLLVKDGLRLDFGAGYTNAELTEADPSQGWEVGDRLPGSPKMNANLAAQYDFNIAGRSAFVRADSFYTGEFSTILLASQNTKAGDYIKLDARAGVAFSPKLSLELFVRNITNEDSFTWRAAAPVRGNPVGGYRLRPRTVGVQVAYSFR